MAETPAGNTPPTPDQARQLAAKFAVVNPLAPRLLTTTEADQYQTLVERLLTSTDPFELSIGMALARVFEGLMAVSGQCYKRESQLRMAEAMLARASSHPVVEAREQVEQLARFATAAISHVAPDTIDSVLSTAGLAWEDLRAAAEELAPKP